MEQALDSLRVIPKAEDKSAEIEKLQRKIDSLKAIGLISRINESLSSSLIIADIYSNPTIKKLASIQHWRD